ncbi:trafficking particle complex subunit 2 [Olea europaea subsp. europaea]|uniref:Trafficking protein particle complex subunit 2-like protein n=1 Tax=Olea europaea subsp. europaea TaxID=158383 RepID=A0A8S0P6M5_OLEEU|nr:trafficking particle complex subunit 2 [Olea europaea subsp. europaea]
MGRGPTSGPTRGTRPHVRKAVGPGNRACKRPVKNPKKSGPTFNETFLGLLYPTENYKVYGYLTNTKVKFIMVTTDMDVRDADVRNFFRRFHAAYVDAVSNPFHVPGKKINSRTFAERFSTIVNSFRWNSAG